MRRHSVDVVPLVLLRKTPNEGPDAGSYTTMRLARAGLAVRFVTCWNGPLRSGRLYGIPAKPTRGCCFGAARPIVTPTCNFSRPMWRRRKRHRGSTVGGQGTGVVNFRQVRPDLARLEAENARSEVFDPSQCAGPPAPVAERRHQ